MPNFMQKALEYLGLRDIEEEEGDDEDRREVAPAGVRNTVYPDPAPSREADVGGSGVGGTVRTLQPLDDRRERSSTGGPRPPVLRPVSPPRHAKPQVVAPARFGDAQEIGDLVKAGHPVIVNLQASERDLARRMIDFCSGLTYALGGTMEKVAEQVFLLTPSNVEVSPEERQRFQDRGMLR